MYSSNQLTYRLSQMAVVLKCYHIPSLYEYTELRLRLIVTTD
jgi:hypothetical protein